MLINKFVVNSNQKKVFKINNKKIIKNLYFIIMNLKGTQQNVHL